MTRYHTAYDGADWHTSQWEGMMGSRSSDIGPVWSDVSRWAREVETTHRGVIWWKVSPSRVVPGHLVGEVHLQRKRGRDEYMTIASVEFRYPGRHGTTMPGVLLAALNQLDRLTEAADAREAARTSDAEHLPLPPGA